jgi:hypothetical protein
MSERPEADKPPVASEPPLKTAEAPKPVSVHPTTAEKPGTGGPSSTDTPSPPDEPKGKGTWYGNAKYPDGWSMHHDQGGTISLSHPTEGSGTWNEDLERWVDMAGHPMPEGWGGGHKPEFRHLKSGPSGKAPI